MPFNVHIAVQESDLAKRSARKSESEARSPIVGVAQGFCLGVFGLMMLGVITYLRDGDVAIRIADATTALQSWPSLW